MMYKSQFKKKITLMTGFVVQGHILSLLQIHTLWLSESYIE